MPCILEMPRVTGDDIQYKLEEINSFLAIRYRMDHPKKEGLCHGSGYVQTTRAWRNTYIGGESREGEFLISSQFQR